MPIDLTTVPEGGGSQRSRRRSHRAQNKLRQHVIYSILAGFVLVGTLAAVPIYFQPKGVKDVVELPAAPVAKPSVEPEAPLQADSVPAVSPKPLPPELTRAQVISLRRVIGPDKSTYLQIEYEFAKIAEAPDKYLIAVSTPAGTGHVAFSPTAARRDVVQLPVTLNKLGSKGPIDVWIETDLTNLRVSNVMTLP